MPTDRRSLETADVDGVWIAKIILKKISDEVLIQKLGKELYALVDPDIPKNIVLDFSNVEYLSSAAIPKLLTLDKKVKAAGLKLRLCCLAPAIGEIFAMTRFNEVFEIKTTREDALKDF